MIDSGSHASINLKNSSTLRLAINTSKSTISPVEVSTAWNMKSVLEGEMTRGDRACVVEIL